MTSKKTKSTVLDKRFYKGKDDPAPEGTEEELLASLGKVLEYQMKIIDYSDKEEFPKEVVEEQRRLLHYGVRGPRRGYFAVYNKRKLWQADVLYILTVTLPTSVLAERYRVSERLIYKIRRGEDGYWEWEYRLIKRIKTAVRCNIKQLKPDSKDHYKYTIYGIHNKQGNILHLVTSKRKAIKYMSDLYKENEECYVEQLEVLH